jgi:hypothetical protein
MDISIQSSDIFQIQKGLKERDALMPLLFNFASEDAIKKVPENQEELICLGHISFCCHVDAVNFFDRNINTELKQKLFYS